MTTLYGMRYFLIVYNRLERRLIECKEFGPEAREEALEERFSRELELQNSSDLEIVILGAESRGVLETTHGRYFHSISSKISAELRRHEICLILD